MTLRLHRRTVDEIDAAVDWYEAQGLGLGGELEDEIDRMLALIERFPLAAGALRPAFGVRVAVLSRFPFVLPYRADAGEVVVLALAHTSRRPYYWRARR